MIEDARRIYGPHNLEEKHLEAALAHSYSLQGDYERAAELYSAVLAEMPDGASMAMLHSVHSQYADVLRHVGRESEAEAHERQAEALLQEIRSLKHQSVIE